MKDTPNLRRSLFFEEVGRYELCFKSLQNSKSFTIADIQVAFSTRHKRRRLYEEGKATYLLNHKLPQNKDL
jgi:hypothetical protein